MPAYTPDLDRELSSGRIALGGCEVTERDPRWADLEWGRVAGTAEILDKGAERDLAAAALLAKYTQYHDLPLDACPVVKVTAERVTEWPEAERSEVRPV